MNYLKEYRSRKRHHGCWVRLQGSDVQEMRRGEGRRILPRRCDERRKRGPWHDVKLHHVSGTTLNLRQVLGTTLNCTTSIHDVKLTDSPWHDFKRHHVLGMTIKGSQKQTPDQALREEAFQKSSDLWLKKPVDLSATEVGSATRRLFEQGAVEQM